MSLTTFIVILSSGILGSLLFHSRNYKIEKDEIENKKYEKYKNMKVYE